MEITTKFKVGDKFWAMKDNHPVEGHVTQIKISVSPILNDYTDLKVEIVYACFTLDGRHLGDRKEDGDFSFHETKEALLKSL